MNPVSAKYVAVLLTSKRSVTVHQTLTMIASLESSKCCGADECERVRVLPTFARVVLLSRESKGVTAFFARQIRSQCSACRCVRTQYFNDYLHLYRIGETLTPSCPLDHSRNIGWSLLHLCSCHMGSSLRANHETVTRRETRWKLEGTTREIQDEQSSSIKKHTNAQLANIMMKQASKRQMGQGLTIPFARLLWRSRSDLLHAICCHSLGTGSPLELHISSSDANVCVNFRVLVGTAQFQERNTKHKIWSSASTSADPVDFVASCCQTCQTSGPRMWETCCNRGRAICPTGPGCHIMEFLVNSVQSL